MRILLDRNLSPKLIRLLADVLPGLESVYDHEIIAASDPAIFDWARRSGFEALVSADHALFVWRNTWAASEGDPDRAV